MSKGTKVLWHVKAHYLDLNSEQCTRRKITFFVCLLCVIATTHESVCVEHFTLKVIPNTKAAKIQAMKCK